MSFISPPASSKPSHVLLEILSEALPLHLIGPCPLPCLPVRLFFMSFIFELQSVLHLSPAFTCHTALTCLTTSCFPRPCFHVLRISSSLRRFWGFLSDVQRASPAQALHHPTLSVSMVSGRTVFSMGFLTAKTSHLSTRSWHPHVAGAVPHTGSPYFESPS